MTFEEFIHNSFLVKLAAAALEILVGFLLAPLIKKMILKLDKRGVDAGVLTFTASCTSIGIRAFAIIIALAQIGVDMSVAVGAFSAIGLGISLALKENMANVAGGMQILMTRPFKVGDYISCQSQEGTVKEIEIMFTTMQTINNQEIIIPNASLVTSTITNYSRYPNRRLVQGVPVSCSADYETFRAQMLDWMNADSRILKDPAPKTVINGFTENGEGMIINLVCYARNEDFWDMKYDLLQAVQQKRTALHLDPPVQMIEVKQG